VLAQLTPPQPPSVSDTVATFDFVTKQWIDQGDSNPDLDQIDEEGVAITSQQAQQLMQSASSTSAKLRNMAQILFS